MIKERIIPEHKEKYIVCDYCGEELNDYSSTSKIYENGTPEKHFHSMHAGGKKGHVKMTCLDLFEGNELQIYIACAGATTKSITPR